LALKIMIDAYNSQISKYNACIGSWLKLWF
jgi:hypothetical protein